jgi:hypothetical protein
VRLVLERTEPPPLFVWFLKLEVVEPRPLGSTLDVRDESRVLVSDVPNALRDPRRRTPYCLKAGIWAE